MQKIVSMFSGERACEETSIIGGEHTPVAHSLNNQLNDMCKKWIKKNFNTSCSIIKTSIKEPERIDQILNITGVEFKFILDDGSQGDSIAYFDNKTLNHRI